MHSYYKQYYLRQSGGGLSDIGSLYKSPLHYQRGRGGIGNFFGSIFRHIKPFLRSGLSALSEQAVKSGTDILANVGKKPLKSVLKEQGKIALNNLAERGLNKFKRMQSGKGRRRKNIKRGRVSKKNHSTVKRRRRRKTKQTGTGRKRRRTKSSRRKSSVKKTRFVDIFDN